MNPELLSIAGPGDPVWLPIASGLAAVCLLLLALLLRGRRTGAARSRLGRRLDEIERLEDLGILAGGLAHEIRHPVGSMQFAVASALERVRRLPDGPTRGEIEGILDGIRDDLKRIEEITHAFLQYARPEVQEAADCDVRESCEFVRRFVKIDLGARGIRLDATYPEERLLVRIPEVHLRQILVNLVLNAAQASAEGSTVRIRVAEERGGVSIEVEDHGSGVPAGQVARLFKPFHTTRAKGVGLGLAISRRFAREAGGDVTYRPAEPAGSIFTVRLPPARKQAREETSP